MFGVRLSIPQVDFLNEATAKIAKDLPLGVSFQLSTWVRSVCLKEAEKTLNRKFK